MQQLWSKIKWAKVDALLGKYFGLIVVMGLVVLVFFLVRNRYVPNKEVSYPPTLIVPSIPDNNPKLLPESKDTEAHRSEYGSWRKGCTASNKGYTTSKGDSVYEEWKRLHGQWSNWPIPK